MYVHSNMPLNNFILLPTRDFFFKKEEKKCMETDLTAVILYFSRYFMSLCMVGLIDLWRRKLTLIFFSLLPAWIYIFFILAITYLTYMLVQWLFKAFLHHYLSGSHFICQLQWEAKKKKRDSHRTIISCRCFRTFENSL